MSSLWQLFVVKKNSFFEGSLAYLTAATHGLTKECDEIQEMFDLDLDTVSEVLHPKVFLDNDKVPVKLRLYFCGFVG